MVTTILQLESRRMPFMKLCMFLSFGILVGRFALLPQLVIAALPYILGAMVCLLCLLEWQWVRLAQQLSPAVCYVLLWLWGVMLVAIERPAYQNDYFGHIDGDRLMGIIDDEPVVTEKTIRFPLRVLAVVDSSTPQHASGKLLLTVRKAATGKQIYRYGDRLVVPNASRPVPPAYNPAQFDYRRHLAHKHIYQQAFVNPENVVLLSSGGGNPVIAFALQAREQLVRKFKNFLHDPYAFQISTTLIFGYRAAMSTEVREAFIHTGTVHVLSVSGLHVSMVFGLLYIVLRFIDRWPYGRSLRFCLTLCAIWSYVVLTGMAPAILRAGIMITFFIVADWSNRKQHNLNTLFASAFFILLFAPHMLMDVGFQLSYMAMVGLFTFYPLLNSAIQVKNKYLRGVMQYTFVSIAAQLFTAPLALYYFHQFPIYFLLANLFIVLPFTAIMYLGIGLACCPWDSISAWMALWLEVMINWVFKGLQTIEALPHAVWRIMDFRQIELYAFLVVLLCLIILWNYRSKKAVFVGLCSLLLLFIASAWRSTLKQSFTGLKVYNMQRELALAVFDKGKMQLLSTLDSLNHTQLAFQVLPDLERYERVDEIKFNGLKTTGQKSNRVVEMLQRRIAILDTVHGQPQELQRLDFVLWRHGNFTPMEYVENSFIIFDGSNSDTRLATLMAQADTLGIRYYVLKNNFAYVWECK